MEGEGGGGRGGGGGGGCRWALRTFIYQGVK